MAIWHQGSQQQDMRKTRRRTQQQEPKLSRVFFFMVFLKQESCHSLLKKLCLSRTVIIYCSQPDNEDGEQLQTTTFSSIIINTSTCWRVCPLPQMLLENMNTQTHTDIRRHTHTLRESLITAVSDQCFISPSQLGWQEEDTPLLSLPCVSDQGNHGDFGSVSSAPPPALIKNLQPVLELRCNWRP